MEVAVNHRSYSIPMNCAITLKHCQALQRVGTRQVAPERWASEIHLLRRGRHLGSACLLRGPRATPTPRVPFYRSCVACGARRRAVPGAAGARAAARRGGEFGGETAVRGGAAPRGRGAVEAPRAARRGERQGAVPAQTTSQTCNAANRAATRGISPAARRCHSPHPFGPLAASGAPAGWLRGRGCPDLLS